MASWLKAAEDLFEVVDRRAKLVVSELSDEQSDSQPPASNGQGTQAKKLKPKRKAQKRLSLNESSSTKTTAQEQSSNLTTQVDVIPEREINDSITEDEKTHFGKSTIPANNKQQQDIDKEDNGPSSNSLEIEVVKTENDHDHIEAPPVPDLEVVSNLRNELDHGNATSVHEEQFLSLPSKGVEGVGAINGDHLNEDEQSNKSGVVDAPSKLDREGSESVATDPQSSCETQSVVVDETEPVSKQNKKPENLPDQSSVKVQDQLDEAQGLLKTAISTGQSKEARLARVCAGLSSRLQEYKSENAQLEELLTAEKELSKSFEARIRQLQEDLFASKNEITRIESNMVEALVAKNSEIENLSNSMDALKKQTAQSEGNLASIQANMDAVMRNRELTETRMMQALREELTSAERRAEEERAAHHATKMAAMEREVDLEHRALESSSALARTQRIADERTLKATELEQKVALLEVECASLNQELQDLEARARREQKKSPDEANQLIQMQAWQEEVERARQGQRDAESKLSSLEAEVQKMRVEMAAMKRDAEHYSRQEHMELENRYRELTDLLYYKQTQLEAMTSEKAAAKFQLEKEIMRHQEAQVEVERSRASRRATTSWEEDTEMKALEPLPLHHRHMSGASVQLHKAAKLLDSGAVRATRFLWRYPIARLMLLFYLVFVHLFLMYLLHRLQEQADHFAAKEVAESMGLSNNQLP